MVSSIKSSDTIADYNTTAKIQLLHMLEAVPVVGTLLTVLDIVVAVTNKLFECLARLCKSQTGNQSEKGVYLAYLKEKHYSRYLCGLIPFAIPLMNRMFYDYNLSRYYFYKPGALVTEVRSKNLFSERVNTIRKMLN